MDRIQQQFASLTAGLLREKLSDFTDYIKKQTGLDVDLIADLRKRVLIILEKNQIRSEKQLNDIYAMRDWYAKTKTVGEEAKKLDILLADYTKRKKEYSEITSIVELEDGTVMVSGFSSTGPKPKHFEEKKEISPDGQRSLHVTQWGNKNDSSTYITVHLPTGSGCIYGTTGLHPDINAWWKDNSTIVIETKRAYAPNTQRMEVSSFDDVIAIEYREL